MVERGNGIGEEKGKYEEQKKGERDAGIRVGDVNRARCCGRNLKADSYVRRLGEDLHIVLYGRIMTGMRGL